MKIMTILNIMKIISSKSILTSRPWFVPCLFVPWFDLVLIDWTRLGPSTIYKIQLYCPKHEKYEYFTGILTVVITKKNHPLVQFE